MIDAETKSINHFKMKKMNKKIKAFALVAAVAAIGGYGIYTSQQTDVMSDLVLTNVEALASPEEDYVIGPWGTNWKTYRTTCVVTYGLNWVIEITKTTTYEADV